MDKLKDGTWWWRWTLTGLIAVCAWFLRVQIVKQETFNTMIEGRVRTLENQVTINSIDKSTFVTFQNWFKEKSNIDAAIGALDRRVMRNEDNMVRVLKGIERIESKLDRQPIP